MRPPLRQLTRLHRWLVNGKLVGPAVGALVFAATFWGLPYRGTNLSGTWLLDAVERTSAWLAAPSPLSATAIEHTWVAHAALPPMTVWWVTVTHLVWPSLGVSGASHLVSSLAFALCVPIVWAFGRRTAGPIGGAAAAFTFVFVPRMVGLATMAGFGTPATLGFLAATYALYRARQSRGWTAAAVIALPVGVLLNPVSVVIIGPWLLLTLTDPTEIAVRLDPPRRGTLRTATFAPRLVLVFVIGVPLIAGLSVLAWTDPIGQTTAYFSHFLIQPKAPFLYLGTLIGAGRLPLHGAPILLAATIPPVTAMLAAVGIVGELILRPLSRTVRGGHALRRLPLRSHPRDTGPEAAESKRWVAALLITSLLLPWIFGGPAFGPVDLLALALPFVAVFAGLTVSRLLSSVRLTLTERAAPIRHWAMVMALTLLGATVFMGPLWETLAAHPLEEAYYSWLFGSTEGAVAKGFARYPYGPLPLPAMAALAAWPSEETSHGVTFVPSSDPAERAYARYRRDGSPAGLPAPASLEGAGLAIVVHDDASPVYYDAAGKIAGSIAPGRSRVLRSGTVRLVTLGAFSKARPLKLSTATKPKR